MNVNLFFKWLWIGELLTFKTGPPCISKPIQILVNWGLLENVIFSSLQHGKVY